MRGTSRRKHVSMRGIVVDMDALRAQNESSVAIGNAHMNARGDIMGTGGTIEIRREQIIRDFYANNPQAAKQVSLKPATVDVFETPAEAMARLTAAAEAASKQPVDGLDEPSGIANKRNRKLVDKGE